MLRWDVLDLRGGQHGNMQVKYGDSRKQTKGVQQDGGGQPQIHESRRMFTESRRMFPKSRGMFPESCGMFPECDRRPRRGASNDIK
jgi:hypothetical protein